MHEHRKRILLVGTDADEHLALRLAGDEYLAETVDSIAEATLTLGDYAHVVMNPALLHNGDVDECRSQQTRHTTITDIPPDTPPQTLPNRDESRGQRSTPDQTGSQHVSLLRRLAWLPIPLLLFSIIVLRIIDQQTSYESAHLLMALNFIFSVLVSAFVAYLIGRSFLSSGVPGLLLLGCGVVIWGAAGFVAVIGGLEKNPGHLDVNGLITIHNSCVWLSSLCQLTGAILFLKPRRPVHAEGVWLTAAYTAALGAVGLVVLSTMADRMPIFFIQGHGGTPVRDLVLGSAIVMFVLTAVLLGIGYQRPLSTFRYWYTLALSLIAVGIFGIMLETVHADPLSWTGRAAQLLSGVYMLIAAIAAVRESGSWSIPLERALEESEEKFRTLFDTLLEGFCIIEMVFDNNGKPVDYRFIDINPAFEEQTGLHDAKGKLMRELVPDNDPHWFEIYGKIALTGEPSRFVSEAKALNRWYDVSAYRIGGEESRKVAILFNDITEQKQAEEALRESRQRLSVVVDSIVDGFYAFDREWRITHINDEALRYFGRKRDEMVGRTMHEALPGFGGSIFEAEFRRAMESGEPAHIEAPSITTDRTVDIHVYPSAENITVLFRDVTERKQAEAALAADLVATTRLQQIGARFVKAGQLAEVLGDIVDAAMAITRADMGNIQLLDVQSGCLKIAASRGFEQPFLDFWNSVAEGQGNCGTAMRNAQRAIVEDVAQSPIFVGTPSLEVQLNAGVRAVQSTPLFGHSGALIGMLSTHWHAPYRPEQRDLHLLDLLAQQAVDIIELARAEDAVRELAQRLNSHMQNSPLAVIEWDPDYRVIRWSEEAERVFGWSADDVLGKRIDDLRWVYEEDWPIVAKLMEDMNAGIRPRNANPNRNYRKDGSVIYCEWYNSVLKDELGNVTSVLSLVLNVTEREQSARELATARAEAERRAAELESFFSSMADGVSMVDSECKIMWMNDAGREILRVPPEETFSDWTSQYQLFTMEGMPLSSEEAAGCRALRGERVKDFRYKAVTPFGETIVLSVSASPVVDSEGRVIGATSTFRDQGERVAFEDEKQLLLDREHRISEMLQQALIPVQIPTSVSGVHFAAKYVPALTEAQVGGDFYDVFDLGDGRVAVLIGDVVGKGVRAAMQVSAARYAFRSYAYIEASPSRIVGLVNDALCKSEDSEISMLTAFFAVVDTRNRTINYTNAGHEPPVVRRAEGSVEELDVGARAIGVLPGCDYPEGSLKLEWGDVVVLVTDGITEARSEEWGMFEKARLMQFLSQETSPPSELVDRLLEKAKEYGNGRLQDDVAIVALGLEKSSVEARL